MAAREGGIRFACAHRGTGVRNSPFGPRVDGNDDFRGARQAEVVVAVNHSATYLSETVLAP